MNSDLNQRAPKRGWQNIVIFVMTVAGEASAIIQLVLLIRNK